MPPLWAHCGSYVPPHGEKGFQSTSGVHLGQRSFAANIFQHTLQAEEVNTLEGNAEFTDSLHEYTTGVTLATGPEPHRLRDLRILRNALRSSSTTGARCVSFLLDGIYVHS